MFVELDLADQDSVRRAAKIVLDGGDAEVIHGLINNAGVMATPYEKTKQGIEVQFGTVSSPLVLWYVLRSSGLIERLEPHRTFPLD